MSNIGNSRPKIKKYSKVFSIHKKAHATAESFLRSTQFKDDLQKLSSDPPKLGVISESFCLISCYAAEFLVNIACEPTIYRTYALTQKDRCAFT